MAFSFSTTSQDRDFAVGDPEQALLLVYPHVSGQRGKRHKKTM